jgi:hypothetical protein
VNARFPADLPQSADAPLPPAAESAELQALAEELRRAHPAPALSEDFSDNLRIRMARSSGLRALLNHSQLARAAATILVISISMAPVLALVHILPWLRETKLVIQVEQLLLPPLAEPAEAVLPPLPLPQDPTVFDPAWIESVTRQNRMARAAASWTMNGAPAPLRTSLEPSTWETASAGDLWQEFLRRCAQGGHGPLPAGLLNRLEVLSLVGGSEERRILAPWIWVVSGSSVPAAEADAGRAWPGAPWIAEE